MRRQIWPIAALCAETTFARSEVNPTPPSMLAQLGADGVGGSRKAAAGPATTPTLPQHLDAAVSPVKELTSLLVDVALAKVRD